MTKGPDEVYCESCGEPIKEHAEICPHCGVRPGSTGSASVATDESFCQSCGEEVKANAELCPNCGVRQSQSSGSVLSQSAETSDLAHYGGWALGVLLILAGLGTFGDGNVVVSFFQGLAYILVGTILLPPTRERFDREFSIGTFGRVRSVDESAITGSDEPCSACYGQIDDGVVRSYAEQFVLFGVPLYTFDRGQNRYCRPCANGETAVTTAETETA